MNRLIVIITVCLLLGAILNFLTSCRIAFEAQEKNFANLMFRKQGIDSLPDERRFVRHVWMQQRVADHIPGDYLHVVRAWNVVEVQMLAAAVPQADNPAFRTWMVAEVVESGWPKRSFSGERVHESSVPLRLCSDLWSAYDRMIIPTRPLWRGFMVNTLFFAAIPFLAAYGWLFLLAHQRWLRRLRMRNLAGCPHCGYDLHGGESQGCPECGWERPAA